MPGEEFVFEPDHVAQRGIATSAASLAGLVYSSLVKFRDVAVQTDPRHGKIHRGHLKIGEMQGRRWGAGEIILKRCPTAYSVYQVAPGCTWLQQQHLVRNIMWWRHLIVGRMIRWPSSARWHHSNV